MRKKSLFLMLFLIAIVLINASSSTTGVMAQSGVTAVVVNDWSNIRIVPAIGAELITSVPAGYLFETVTGRSGDNQWLRIDFNGNEGWVHTATLTVLAGDMYSLPVADPRSIPYGGFEAARSGITGATSEKAATLLNGVHVRAGPSTGYPILAEAMIHSVVPLLGRTANSAWVQINYQGTLGWISSRYLRLSVGTVLGELPIDGIIADGPVIGDPTGDDYLETLYFLLARVDLAQPSLDTMRTYWTDTALNGRAHCDAYPARPSNHNIPNALLASHYTELDPLIRLFNDAMGNVRLAVDSFIEVCNQPGTQNPVSQAVAIEGLDVVALADSQFLELRRRLNELLPEPVTMGIGECVFTFNNQTTILPLLPIGEVFTDNFTPKKWVSGYCFDGLQGQSLVFETLQLGASDIVQLLAVSPFDDPTNFVITGEGYENDPSLIIGPVMLPLTGRYILILHHTLDYAPTGEFALIIHEPFAGVYGSILQVNPVTGDISVGIGGVAGTTGTTACPDFTLTCPQLLTCEAAYACLWAGNGGLDHDSNGIPCEAELCGSTIMYPPSPSGGDCPNMSFTCGQLTCAQAYACLNAGNFSLDGNNDGVPCEEICPSN